MSAETPLVSGVDFVTLPTRDFDTATEFYGEVLGLPCSARYGKMPGAEFETGTLTIAAGLLGSGRRPERRPNLGRESDG